MRHFSGQKRITGILTFLCILLLSTTAMAAQPTGNTQATAVAQSGSADSASETTKSSSENLETSDIAQTSQEEVGPGIIKKAEPEETKPKETVYTKGESLGLFSATAYCPRSGKQSLTYSGTIPRPNHTLSADTTILPLGTRVMIDNTIYTVEDIGSAVKGNTVDIFFGSYAEAINFGRQTKELFLVIEQ